MTTCPEVRRCTEAESMTGIESRSAQDASFGANESRLALYGRLGHCCAFAVSPVAQMNERGRRKYTNFKLVSSVMAVSASLPHASSSVAIT